MRIQTTLRKSRLIAPAIAFGILLGGCDRLDTSKPDAGEVQEAVQQVYGSCPIWSVSDVQKDNGVPVQGREIPLYAGQLSFTVSLKVASDEAANAVLRQNAAACVYPLISGGLARIHPSQNQRYRVSLQLLFARADRGWSVLVPMPDTAAVINLYNRLGISVIAQVAPLTSTGAPTNAQEGTATDTGNPGIIHRLNLAVMSLLHIGRSRPDGSNDTDGAASGAAPSAGSGTVATASSANPLESSAPVADAASAAASGNASDTAETASAALAAVPAASSSASPVAVPASAPVVDAPVASASQSDAGADRAAIASQVQAAKLQLLMQKAQDAMNAAQYQSAVATAETILLLDPDNVQAQQLRAKALRLTQRTQAAVTRPVPSTPPVVDSPPALLPPAQQPVARPLAEADLEGDWHGTYQCGPYIGSGSGSVADPDAWTRHVKMSVHNGQATLVRQSERDATFKEVISGNVLPDLSLHLGGTGQRAGDRHPWNTDFMGQFNGTTGPATFQASGTLSNWRREEFRACRLALSR